jgi:hypothetical protein
LGDAYRLKPYSFAVTVFLLQHPGRFPTFMLESGRHPHERFGLQEYVWFSQTGARKGLEYLV